MIFEPYIELKDGNKMSVIIRTMRRSDAERTKSEPVWQTDWTSEYIETSLYEKYAVETANGELIALGMYEVLERALVVRVVYMESQPESNPTLTRQKKYQGIGKAMIAFGIQLSIDANCNGVVVFEAKTDELEQHYIRDFGARPVASLYPDGPKTFMIADQAAKDIFSSYLF